MTSAFDGPEPMDLENFDASKRVAQPCSICLELVLLPGDRSIAKLFCGHEFHLDCIGSAFNAKGEMQCPNCRKVERGQWLYASTPRSSTDRDLENSAAEIFDLRYPEMPIGIRWCPIRGLAQLASILEEGGFHSHSLYGDHSSAPISSHICPYLALRGFPHPLRATPSGAADPIPENVPFHRHPTNLAGPLSGDMLNSQNFPATEAQSRNWQPHIALSYPISGNYDQAMSQLASGLSRNDTNTHQRIGSFVHPHTYLRGTVAHPGSNMIAGQAVIGEVRGHTRGYGGHMYQQPAPPSSVPTSAFASIRRARPRGLHISTPMAPSSNEVGGLYGVPFSGHVNMIHPDGEIIGREFERFHGWNGEVGSTLPWVPADTESQWSTLHSTQNLPPGSAELVNNNIFLQRAAERVNARRLENAHHSRRLHPRMPPYM